ncbi:MAG: chemotaxis-specific protein-glutamate methyltransferase CheB [Acidobacteriota bacterium]
MIRVLVVDDSPVMRHILFEALSGQPDIQVIGYARDGKEAVYLAERLRPDLITMDLVMPEMNGVEATYQIMARFPVPILIMSSAVNKPTDQLAFDAIAAGALSIVIKPKAGSEFQTIQDELLTKIRLMSQVKVVKRRAREEKRQKAPLFLPTTPSFRVRIVAIGSSTGGPAALNAIFSNLPPRFPVPIVVVQHMTHGFLAGMVRWLSANSANLVKMGQNGEMLRPGNIYVAPENAHMGVTIEGKIALDDGPPVEGARPSINRLFEMVAASYGPMALALLLTGMGSDGVSGLSRVKSMGGRTMAQDESTSVVFGMPQQAIQAGIVDRVVRLDDIPRALVDALA